MARTRQEDTRLVAAAVAFAYWQVPETHPCPAAQVVPHVPQFAPSVERSEHVPAQFTVPAGQAQAPSLHTRLLPQICEQSPQFSLLFCRSTHVGGVPHEVNPDAEQRTAQVPSLQTGSAPVHRVPHAPQFPLLDERSTQLPTPPFLPAHWVYPAAQAHVPLTQGAPPGHAVPHDPQLRLFVCRSTHAIPHSVSPALVLHVPVQAPAVHSVFAGHR
jgi:hypothetical protein